MSLELWVVTHKFRPLWSGPAERFARYAAGFGLRGVHTTFVTPQRESAKHEEFNSDFRILRVGNEAERPLSNESFVIKAIFLALKSNPRPNVLLFFGLSPVHIPFLWILKLCGIRAIYVSTMALTNVRDNGQERSLLRQTLLNLSLRALHESLDYTVSSTSALSEEFQKLGVRKKKLLVISNGLNLKRFRPVKDEDEKLSLRNKLSLPAHGPIALFVGLIVERKGVIKLLESWKLHKSQGGAGSLVFVGAEQREIREFGSFYREWDEILKTLKDSDEVYFHPPASHIEQYYQASDLFIFLSQVEGMPNVLGEAMGSCLPVITHRFIGFSKEFGRADFDFVFAKDKPLEISKQISLFVEDANRRKRMGLEARNWIEKTNDVERSLDLYTELFESLR